MADFTENTYESNDGVRTVSVPYDHEGQPRWVTPVRQYGSIGSEMVSFHSLEEYEPGEHTVFTEEQPLIVDSLEWVADNLEAQIIIRNYDGNESYGACLRPDGSWIDGFIAFRIAGNGSDLFNVLSYDEDKNEYKFSLKEGKKIYLPEGLSLRFKNNTSSTNVNFGFSLMGRKVL